MTRYRYQESLAAAKIALYFKYSNLEISEIPSKY